MWGSHCNSVLILKCSCVQVHVTIAELVKVFAANKASICRKAATIRQMLTETARLLPWMAEVEAKHIVLHVSTIVKIPFCTKQPACLGSADQVSNKGGDSPRKRKRAAVDNTADYAADNSDNQLSSSTHLPNRSRVVASVQSISVYNDSFEHIIPEHELGDYLQDRAHEASRLMAWQAQQDAMQNCKLQSTRKL